MIFIQRTFRACGNNFAVFILHSKDLGQAILYTTLYAESHQLNVSRSKIRVQHRSGLRTFCLQWSGLFRLRLKFYFDLFLALQWFRTTFMLVFIALLIIVYINVSPIVFPLSLLLRSFG